MLLRLKLVAVHEGPSLVLYGISATKKIII